MCTCGQDDCNSRMGALEMMARAEMGVTGVGRYCHQCRGQGGLCGSSTDAGRSLDCGQGVNTCILAHNSKYFEGEAH